MSSISNNYKIKDPVYCHSEHNNDIKKEQKPKTLFDQSKRVALVALPFISLYKPLGRPLSLVTGSIRAYSSITQLLDDIKKGKTKEIPYHLLQSSIAVIALASSIFAHPMGMLITTGHDLIIDLTKLARHLQNGNYKEAFECCGSILNNVLYLALFTYGGPELAIASFALQILLGLNHARHDFAKGNNLEAVGHLLMSMVRASQLAGQVHVLNVRSKIANNTHLHTHHKGCSVANANRPKLSMQCPAHIIRPGRMTRLDPAKMEDQSWDKVVQYAREHFPLEGRLVTKSDGFTYIKVDDEYIHKLFPMLGLEKDGFKEPPYFRRPEAPGAHISVINVNENVVPKEIGEIFHFNLKQITLVQPTRDATYVVLQVEAPELESLREKYGLSPNLNGHDFHITLGKKVHS